MIPTDEQIKAALQKVKETFGLNVAIQIEKVFRNETKHFKSEGFALSLSPGMEAITTSYPYGWMSLQSFWDSNLNYKPIGIIEEKENSSAMMASRGIRKFVHFENVEASMMSVASVISKRGGDGGAWFSNIAGNPQRKKYNEALTLIKSRFI